MENLFIQIVIILCVKIDKYFNFHGAIEARRLVCMMQCQESGSTASSRVNESLQVEEKTAEFVGSGDRIAGTGPLSIVMTSGVLGYFKRCQVSLAQRTRRYY